MPESINNPLESKYMNEFSNKECILEDTNKNLAPLLSGDISDIKKIKIKNIRILKYEINDIKQLIRDLCSSIYSVPYYLGKITIEVETNKQDKTFKLDVGLAVFFDRINNYQLNNKGNIQINDFNIDFIINDYNYINENSFVTLRNNEYTRMTIRDILKIFVPNISSQLYKDIREHINHTPELRKAIVEKYKKFQLNMNTIYESEENIKENNDKIYRPIIAAISANRKKAYMDSDIFYFDVGERYWDDIIHDSLYRKYFEEEFVLYKKGYSKNNPEKGIEIYIEEIIMDIGCGTGEKAENILKKMIEMGLEKEHCYIGFDTNSVAIYDANYNMHKGYILMNENEQGEFNQIDNTIKKDSSVTYLFSEGMLSDLIDNKIKFVAIDNIEPTLTILQRNDYSDKKDIYKGFEKNIIEKKFDHYKNIFVRNQSIEEEKKEIIDKINDLVSQYNKENAVSICSQIKALYQEHVKKREIFVDGEAFKKAKKTILIPGGTFGNFMQNDTGLQEYIKKLEEEKKVDGIKSKKKDAYIANVNGFIKEMQQKNNSQRFFLKDIQRVLSNKEGDYALFTVFTKPSKSDKEYYRKIKQIEKMYNSESFRQKYISLFRKLNINEKDLEYSAKYEKDDKIHIYVRIKNPKGIFFPFVLNRKSEPSIENHDIIYSNGEYLGIDIPFGFTFHCQASKRFSDEDMYNIIEIDENGNSSGLKIVDEIIHPDVLDMKIFVIGTSEIDSK